MMRVSGAIMNREEWLALCAEQFLWPRIRASRGKRPKKVRLSVGFPKGSRGGKSGHAIGQCWSAQASADGHCEVFVSPELDCEKAIGVLAHELVHVSVGTHCDHRGPFKELARKIGLVGPMRFTVPSESFRADILDWMARAPAFPHAPLRVPAGQVPKPGSRLLKCFCPGCGYTVRVTRQWLDIALPKCPDVECDSFDEQMIEE